MILWQDAVYDRTQADVDKLKSYIAAGWESLSDEQKTEWLSGMKGAINSSDIDRIQNNINLLCEVLEIDKKLCVGRNLIPFPYVDSNMTKNGITWTVKEDGSIIANGTATENSAFWASRRKLGQGITPLYLQKGNSYTISGLQGGSSSTYYIEIATVNKDTGEYLGISNLTNGYKVFNSVPYDNTITSVTPLIVKGATVNNLVFKPMLELGETPHEYEIYQTDRTANIPYATTIADMLDIVDTIRKSYSIHAGTPKTPTQPVNTFKKWNDIEKILFDVHDILLNNFHYYAGNEIYAGDSIGYLL